MYGNVFGHVYGNIYGDLKQPDADAKSADRYNFPEHLLHTQDVSASRTLRSVNVRMRGGGVRLRHTKAAFLPATLTRQKKPADSRR